MPDTGEGGGILTGKEKADGMAGKYREILQEIQDEHREFTRARGMPSDQRQLLDSVKKRNPVKVEKLLSQGVDICTRDPSGCPLLHVVAQSNPTEDAIKTLKTLLYFGADPDGSDRFGRTALHLAVTNSSKLVQTLLEAGCSTNRQDNAGRSPLMEACAASCPDALVTVTMLMDRNCNMFLQDQEGSTALHSLCKNRKQNLFVRNEIALKLLMAGLSVSVCDKAGKMALCYELDRFVNSPQDMQFNEASFKVARTLLQAGARFNPRVSQHERWIQMVANFSSIDLLRHLLRIAEPALPLSVLKKLPKLTSAAEDESGLFQKHLRTLSRRVRPLQQLCRIVVRGTLKGKVLPSVTLLPLPPRLQSYLTLDD